MAAADRARAVAAAHHHQAAFGRAGRRRDPCSEWRHGARSEAGRRTGYRVSCMYGNSRMDYDQKLDQIEARFQDLTSQMADPAVISDSESTARPPKRRAIWPKSSPSTASGSSVRHNLEEGRAMLNESDPELRQMAAEEVARLEPELAAIEEDLKVLLLPKDPHDEKNVVLEIRAGTGGDEATLFAAEVFRMYSRFAETQRWKVEVTSAANRRSAGLKEVIALVSGNKVYSQLKYESGVHRVQRVPPPSSRAACTLRRSRWRCCPKRTKWKSRSKPKTSASIRSAPRVRAASP